MSCGGEFSSSVLEHIGAKGCERVNSNIDLSLLLSQLRKEGSSLSKSKGSMYTSWPPTSVSPSIEVPGLSLSTSPESSFTSPISPQSYTFAGPRSLSILNPSTPPKSPLSPKGHILSRQEWLPDSAVQQCQNDECDVRFRSTASQDTTRVLSGFTNMFSLAFQARRHHCRACGKIFCRHHSSNSLPLLATNDYSHDVISTREFPKDGLSTTAIPSGTSTPSGAATAFSHTSSTKHNQAGQIIDSRVCDVCFLSLSLGANLYNPSASYSHDLERPPYFVSEFGSGSRLSPPGQSGQVENSRSGPVSARQSPTHSRFLSSAEQASSLNTPGLRHHNASSDDSTASSNQRGRQTSAGTESIESADTSATTPPYGPSGDVSPNVLHGVGGKVKEIRNTPFSVSAAVTPAPRQPSARLSTIDAAERTESPSQYRQNDDIVKMLRSKHAEQNPRQMHPLDPRHVCLTSGKGLCCSNPDSSLEATLPSTPGVGWTWST